MKNLCKKAGKAGLCPAVSEPKARLPRKISVLRMRRIKRGETLVDVSRRVRVSHAYLSMIERGYGVSEITRDRVCREYVLPANKCFVRVGKKYQAKMV